MTYVNDPHLPVIEMNKQKGELDERPTNDDDDDVLGL